MGFAIARCDEVLLPVYAIIAKAVAIQPTEPPAGTPKK